MASSTVCCAVIPFPLSRPRSAAVSSISATRSSRVGLPVRVGKRLGAWNPSSGLRVSCLRDTKAGQVTGKSWEKLILNSDTPVLVEFHASWCGPCRMVHRVIDEIANDYSGKIKCYILDVDLDSRIAEKCDIKAVPVVLLFKNGEKRDYVIGTMPKEFYVDAIERVLSS